MANTSLIHVEDFYFAGLLDYRGYWLAEVDGGQPRTVFIFDMPQWSHDELWEAWQSEESQSLSSGRLYGESLKRLDYLQRKAKRDCRDDGFVWFNPAAKKK